jgi:hypothetical protein
METLSYPTDKKANKDHTCDFCAEKIHKNEIYVKSTHKFDGQVYDWKTHKYCAKLATTLNMYDDAEEGLTQEVFMETVSCVHDDVLISKLPENEIVKYRDIIQQLQKVKWREKLWFLIRHYAKLESESIKLD